MVSDTTNDGNDRTADTDPEKPPDIANYDKSTIPTGRITKDGDATLTARKHSASGTTTDDEHEDLTAGIL